MKPLKHRDGFALLEVMLAVMIFGIAVLGLLTALHKTIETATDFNREEQVSISLQNQLAEADEIEWTGPDTDTVGPDELGVVYTKEIEPLQLENRNGQPLNGLYRLRITASWGQGTPGETQTAEVYVYKP